MTNIYPKVSVIIPALNEDKYIKECLDSVIKLEYPKDRYEVIVVDNGSTDNTNKIVAGYPVKLIEKPGIKVGAVRNAGVAESDGDILAFTDADCVLPERWLNDALDFLFSNNVGAVGGGCLVKNNSTWLERAWVTGQSSEVIVAKYLPGANFIVSRKVFIACGGFDEDLVAGEDDKLSIKIMTEGYQLLSVRQCFVTHLGYPKTLYDVIKRQIWHSKNSIDITNPLTNKLFIATNTFIACNLMLLLFILYDKPILYVSSSLLTIIFIINAQPIKKVIAWNKQNDDVPKAIIKLIQLNIIYYCYFIGRSIGLFSNYVLKIEQILCKKGL